ncbi:uncharacterized protein FIESC28_00221 [Fusarium coffeatum]|uniref:Uncharacterized protein n=1 Tax=Fusarium coffeatum TaxID=231269 RepID=A0A366SCB0_9HYPO|nr:uncharacterized protein FIESC28_00221 [Fusarium coffeatum]RBR26953.1 hypothetical protein FIESC28_00221 [Fusarium coffeatum]
MNNNGAHPELPSPPDASDFADELEYAKAMSDYYAARQLFWGEEVAYYKKKHDESLAKQKGHDEEVAQALLTIQRLDAEEAKQRAKATKEAEKKKKAEEKKAEEDEDANVVQIPVYAS